MTDKIFISYRRDDSKAESRSIYQRLERTLGRSRLFMDVDTIKTGENFRDALDQALSECGAMLVVIGQRWVDFRSAGGISRLHDPNDFVTLEVASALKRGVAVVPVLVDGAKMPEADQLPDALKGLALRQAAIVTHDNFSSDMERLERHLNALGPAGRLGRSTRVMWAAGMFAVALAGTALWWWTGGRPSSALSALACGQEPFSRSPSGTTPTTKITFINKSGSTIKIYWLNGSGARVPYSTVAPGTSLNQGTYVGHLWVATDTGDRCVGLFTAAAAGREFVIN